MVYSDDMSQERKPSSLFPEGKRAIRILEMMETKSKAGNRMFQTVIEDIKTKATMTCFLVAEPKKRWMLKSLLTACQLPAGADGVYKWDVTDVIGKSVIADIQHKNEDWINREGQTVTSPKANVTEFIAGELSANGEAIAWEE